MNAQARDLALGLPHVPDAGPDAALATFRGETRPGHSRTRTAAAERVLRATLEHWDLTGPDGLPRPRGGWLHCPCCGVSLEPVIRYWQFHIRPGTPTVPWRCDVSMKCRACAALWVHGIALPESAYLKRPAPAGLRAWLLRGSNFEPRIWKGVS